MGGTLCPLKPLRIPLKKPNSAFCAERTQAFPFLRKNYLHGCGQLCEDCCAELNRSTANRFEMTETEMEYLLEITKNAKERDFSESNENS